jgi:hypothetical protein
MRGTNIGEFEELVLLTVAALMQDAYSVAICDELSNHTGRSAKLGVVQAVSTASKRRDLLKVSWVKQRRPAVVNAKDSIKSLYRESRHWSAPSRCAIACGIGYRRLP